MLLKYGFNSSMWVDQKNSKDETVYGPDTKIKKFINSRRQHLRFPINKILNSNLFGMHSPSLLPSNWLKKINRSDADLIHLHWVQGEMLTIKEISKITKPLLWTFHDMWPFCGCEHYAYNLRYSEGYTSNNRSKNEPWFFDVNRWRWKEKFNLLKTFTNYITITMDDCVKKLYNETVEIIPHPIDISEWENKNLARSELNLPIDSKLIIFGAIGGNKDKRKGFEFVISALKYLKEVVQDENINIVIFGGNNKNYYPEIDFKVHHFNKISDNKILVNCIMLEMLWLFPQNGNV